MKPKRGRLPGDFRVVVGQRRLKLPRTLGASALFAACYGNVGSSIYYALGVTAAFALGLTPLALILAGLIFVTTALNYAEGTAAIPHAGGSSSFARRAFNEPLGFLVGWVQLLNYTATVSISAYFAIGYLRIFGHYLPVLNSLQDSHAHAVAALVLVGLLIVINIIGIQESSALNFLLAIVDLGTQVVLVVLGLLLLLNFRTILANIHLGVAPTWGTFLASISIAMVSYTGIETISNLSEEARNPGKTVPRATFGVIIAVLFVSAFLPTIGMSVFPVHLDAHGHYVTALATRWKDDPVAGIVSFFHPQWLASLAGIWVGILAFTILVVATNAGLIGISRLSFSLATNNLFPRVFSRLHPKYRTPYIAIIVFGIAAGLLILPAQIDLMAAVYSLAATFAFATAHLAVMRLRFVAPRLRRPFEMPLNIPTRAGKIPVLSVVGALAIGSVFTQLIFENISNSTFIYLGWLIVGALIFVAYRTYRQKPIWEPLESTPPPEGPAGLLDIGPRRPTSERVHVRRHRAAAATEPGPHAHEHVPRRSQRPPLPAIVVGVVIGVAAIVVDLSPLDPTGTRLGWSPGVVLIIAIVLRLLVARDDSGRR
ncbi:MAG TPA: APC family permease [Candidatus Dormibacteraeota bacterium]